MSSEDISELSSNSCSSKTRELKSLLSTGSRGGRMEKMISNNQDFFNKSSFDVTEGVDEKSEYETFNVDDNIIINIDNLQKSMSEWALTNLVWVFTSPLAGRSKSLNLLRKIRLVYVGPIPTCDKQVTNAPSGIGRKMKLMSSIVQRLFHQNFIIVQKMNLKAIIMNSRYDNIVL